MTDTQPTNINSNDENKCKPLFAAVKTKNPFDFSQMIPTIVSIGIFIYGMSMFPVASETTEYTSEDMDINQLYVIFVIGFFIIFLNNLFNGDKKWKEFYNQKMKNVKGIAWVYFLLRRFFNYKIKTFEPEVLFEKLPMIKGVPIKYYEYPLNMSIGILVMIILLISRILYLKNQDSKDILLDLNNNKNNVFAVTHWVGIIGILLSLFTNRYILSITDDQLPGQEKRWMVRLLFYVLAFVSIIYFIGKLANEYTSIPIAKIDISDIGSGSGSGSDDKEKLSDNAVQYIWLTTLTVVILIISGLALRSLKKK